MSAKEENDIVVTVDMIVASAQRSAAQLRRLAAVSTPAVAARMQRAASRLEAIPARG